MPKRESVGRNALFLSLNPLFWGVVGVVTTGYVARSIGTVEYGKLSFAFAFVNFFTMFTNLGFNNYLMKEFAGNPAAAEDQFVLVLIIRAFLALLTYAGGAIVIHIMDYPPATRMIYYAAGLVVFPRYLIDTSEGVFKGQERMHFIASLRFTYNLLFNAMRCLLVYLGYKAYELAWNRVFVEAFAMLLSLYFIYRYFLKFNLSIQRSLFKRIFIGTLPYAFSTSFLIIYNRLDIIMLSYFVGDEAVAYYRSAFVLTEKLAIITVALVGAVYPAIARLAIKDKGKAIELYNRTFFYLFLVSVPIAVGGYFLAGKVINLIYGEKYMQAVTVLKLLIVCVPLVFATNVMGNVLMATDQAKLFTYTMTALCVANIVANLILIPIYAHVGAALATLFAQVINFGLLIVMTFSRFGPLSPDVKYIKVLLSAAVMGGLIVALNGWNVFPLACLGGMTYFLCIWLLRTFQKEELVELKDMVFKRRS